MRARPPAPSRLPALLLVGALVAGTAACGGTSDPVDDPLGEGGAADEQPVSDAEDDDMADDTSMPADEDVQPDGSVSRAEAEAVATAYVGLTEEEAEEQARVDDRPYRVGARDGEQFMLTEDYVVGRITVTITDGVVTAATVESSDGQVTVEG